MKYGLIAISVCLAAVLCVIAGKVFAIKDETTAAYIGATRAVSMQLKSPASARFPSWLTGRDSFSVRQMNDGSYEVESWVDASNQYGATMRSRWKCTVRPGVPEWSADSCQLIDNTGLSK